VPYKVRRLQYKISEIQAFAGAALYLYLPENILQTPEFLALHSCGMLSANNQRKFSYDLS